MNDQVIRDVLWNWENNLERLANFQRILDKQVGYSNEIKPYSISTVHPLLKIEPTN